MAYRIFTYANPYEINKAPYWNEIRDLPHFCVARTLVNGLVDVMQDSIGGLICPLDDLVKLVYQDWEGNIERRIEQYSYLTKLFATTKAKSKDPKKESFAAALEKNQGQFLDAIRLFIELNIPPLSLHEDLATKEQKAFIRVLSKIQKDRVPVFRFPKAPELNDLKGAINTLAENEIKEYRKQMKNIGQPPDPRREQWLTKNQEATRALPLTGIVVHGVHQFSPTQIRLITELGKRDDFTIYFLFNYQEKFTAIYESWLNIYGNFDAKIETDGKEFAVIPPQNRTESNALAIALGCLCEGRYSPADPIMRSSYEKYKSVDFIKFANLTEYTNYVADCVDAAKVKHRDRLDSMEQALTPNSSRAVLRLLDEQVYTANREIHDLLNVYFPEYSKNRHFLAYPIGQFFSGIYHLWDWKKGEIKFDLSVIRECISSGLLECGQAQKLLRISYVLETVLGGVEQYSGKDNSFLSQMEKYLCVYDEVSRATANTTAAEAKSLSIYDPNTISRQEIVLFANAVKELNTCAAGLFGRSQEDFVHFGEHFGRLQDFIKSKKTQLANEIEIKLINDLLERLNHVADNAHQASGTYTDLKQGLYFYLKQKQEDQSSDWVVKNFEQIDGDILHSRKQNHIFQRKMSKGIQNARQKVYHFACLSDRDMNLTTDDLLPWPLTDQFIMKAYTPVDLQFQVYYSALSERSNFLRYALFYGLYFNFCDVRLSYVEQIREDVAEPYTLLMLLGLKPADYQLEVDPQRCSQIIPENRKLKHFQVDQYHLMSMMLCPHRYMMEYVIEEHPVANSDLLYQKIFESALLSRVWKRCVNQKLDWISSNLAKTVKIEANKLWKYFFFWTQIQIEDICRRVINYMNYRVLSSPKNVQNGYLRDRGDIQLNADIRKHYGQGSIYVDISEKEPKNPYPSFESETQIKGSQKIYNLHRFSQKRKNHDKYVHDMQSYLNQTTADKQTVASSWCAYCAYKEVCLEPFINKES